MKSKAQNKKEELYHYDGVEGKAVVVYLLKAKRYSELTGLTNETALGVYSKGEWRAMRTHAHKHLAEFPNDQVHELETFLTL